MKKIKGKYFKMDAQLQGMLDEVQNQEEGYLALKNQVTTAKLRLKEAKKNLKTRLKELKAKAKPDAASKAKPDK